MPSNSVPLVYINNPQGGLMPSTANSAMLMAFQENIAKTGAAAGPVPDHKYLASRQAMVDTYFAEHKNVVEYEGKAGVIDLPRLASPQRLHTSYQKRSVKSAQIEKERKGQYELLRGSFMGAVHNRIYREIDRAVQESQAAEGKVTARKASEKNLFSAAISNLGKTKSYSDAEKNEILEPVETAIEGINAWMKSLDLPCRVVWREIVDTDNRWSLDMWMMYANSPAQAASGLKTWLGIDEVVDVRNTHNKNASRLNPFNP